MTWAEDALKRIKEGYKPSELELAQNPEYSESELEKLKREEEYRKVIGYGYMPTIKHHTILYD